MLRPRLSENFSFTLHFQWWFNYLVKEPILAQECQFFQKTTNQQSWKFSIKSNFDLNQIYKISLTQKHLIWNFNAYGLLYIFFYDCRNTLKLQKMSKNSSLKETGPSYGQRFVCSDNPRQNI